MQAVEVRREATGRSAGGFWVGTPLTLLALFLTVGEEWRETPGTVLVGALVAAALVGAVAGFAFTVFTARWEDVRLDAAGKRRSGDWERIPDVDAVRPRWLTPRAVLTWSTATAVHILVVVGACLLMARVGVPVEDRDPDLWWQLTLTLLFLQVLGFGGGAVVGLLAGGVRQFLEWARRAPTAAERVGVRALTAFLVVACTTALPLALAAEDRAPAGGRGRRAVGVWRDVVSVFDDPVARGVSPVVAFAAQAGVVVLLLIAVVAGLRVRRAQARERRRRLRSR